MKKINGVRFYGRDDKIKEDFSRCIEEVWETGAWTQYQCSRKRGHGPNGLYCKQHDPIAIKAKHDKKDAKYKEVWDDREKRDNRRRLEEAYCAHLSNEELEKAIP